jgi:hypothetical protein
MYESLATVEKSIRFKHQFSTLQHIQEETDMPLGRCYPMGEGVLLPSALISKGLLCKNRKRRDNREGIN